MQNNVFFFLILSWLGFFFFFLVEVRAFIVVMLKLLAFNTLKNYFLFYHPTLQYTQYQMFYFLLLHLK